MKGMILMNQDTRELLHQEYCKAVSNSVSGIQVFKTFYNSLEKAEIIDEDSDIIDAFFDGIRGTLGQRAMYKDMEEMMDSQKITLQKISLWQDENPEFKQGSDSKFEVKFTSRMKQAGSTLAKLLSKSLTSNESVSIRDTYGIRGVVRKREDQSEEAAIQYVYRLYDSILGIVAQRSRKKKESFQQWLSTQDLSFKERNAINFILSCPFGISFRKDYIKNPKPNGYQTLQFTLSTPMYSPVLPGAQIEVQLRTEAMHFVATEGTAKHEDFKDALLKEVKGIFTLEEDS